MQKPFLVNNQIRSAQVQVIDDTGKQLGVLKIFDALKIAKDKDLDLVEVGPNANPPVTKVMDYGKFLYQKERQEKKSAVKHKETGRKTVRVGFKTGKHDLEFKARQVDGFLREGHIVKVELTLRGREKALAHLGKEKLNSFLGLLAEKFDVQEDVKRSPFGWTTAIRK